ncbi:MAG: DUF6449 domain-containing protein, partial [Candidatus Weimeria sp.]
TYDLTGYSRWIPDKADVKSAYIAGSDAIYDNEEYAASYMKLTDIDTVNALLDCGEKSTREHTKDTVLKVPDHYIQMTIAYRMKSGRTVSRKVIIPPRASDLMEKIISSDEFRQGYFRIFHDEKIMKNLNRISVSYQNNNNSATELYSKNGDIYPEIKAAYEKDIRSFDYATASTETEAGQINIDVPAKGQSQQIDTVTLPVYSSFTNTIRILQKYDIYVAPDKDNPLTMNSEFYTGF